MCFGPSSREEKEEEQLRYDIFWVYSPKTSQYNMVTTLRVFKDRGRLKRLVPAIDS